MKYYCTTNSNKFSFFKHTEEVRKAGFNLKCSKVGVSEQFPPEVNAIRRRYWPVYKQAKQEGKRTKTVADKLYIDGGLYEPED